MTKSEIERLERLYRDQIAAFDKWTALINQPAAGFIVGDWSVTYPAVSICHKCGAQNVTALCPDCLPPKRDVFPRQAMRD